MRYDSFIVRVLSRPIGSELVGGQVTHTATRRTLRFTDLQRVVGFILAQLGRASVEPDPKSPEPIWPHEAPASDGLPSELDDDRS